MDKSNRAREITQEKSKYIRVTEVLSPFTGLSSIPKHIVENAANRGTRVHAICESIVKGLGEFDMDAETTGYVKSFKHWWENGHSVVATEQRFYCDELGISGQCDVIVDNPQGGHRIIDYKTSAKESKTWALQGSAYAYLARKAGYDIRSIQFVHLFKDGSPAKVIEYDDCWDLYLSALNLYKYFNPEKKNGKR